MYIATINNKSLTCKLAILSSTVWQSEAIIDIRKSDVLAYKINSVKLPNSPNLVKPNCHLWLCMNIIFTMINKLANTVYLIGTVE